MSFYSISTLHAWNSRLVPLFGFPLNVLLFWLVWTKTPKEMRVHSRILLQTAIVDLAFACADLIATPVVITYNPNAIVLFDGHFVQIFSFIFNSDHPRNLMILYFISGTFFLFDIYSISVQFIYRYLVLKRNIKISLANYFWMVMLSFIASFIVGISYMLQFGDIVGLTEELRDSSSVTIDWPNSIYFISQNNKAIWGLFPVLAMIIAYSINIFCGLKVVKFVSAHSDFNPRTKQLNQQLTKSLIILASFPLFSLLQTILISVLISALKIIGIQVLTRIIMYEQFVALLINAWVIVVNPVVSIWFNTPYRDAVKKFMDRLFKNNSITPVQTLNE